MIGSVAIYQSLLKRVLKRPTSTCTLLDLCCGETNHIRGLDWKAITCVDVIDEKARIRQARFVKLDVLAFLADQSPKSFDVVICSDGIEHFPKEEGDKVIAGMERVGRFCFVFTPLGPFGHVIPTSTDPHIHKSEWWPSDFDVRGWETKTYPTWHTNTGAFFAWRDELNI